MKEKFLPIGSVVLLNNATKRLMITGYCVSSKDDLTVVYDYSGCLFPEGIFSTENTELFNHDQIFRIDHLGLEDEEYKNYDATIKSFLSDEAVVENEDNTLILDDENQYEKLSNDESNIEIPTLDFDWTIPTNSNAAEIKEAPSMEQPLLDFDWTVPSYSEQLVTEEPTIVEPQVETTVENNTFTIDWTVPNNDEQQLVIEEPTVVEPQVETPVENNTFTIDWIVPNNDEQQLVIEEPTVAEPQVEIPVENNSISFDWEVPSRHEEEIVLEEPVAPIEMPTVEQKKPDFDWTVPDEFKPVPRNDYYDDEPEAIIEIEE